MADSILTTTKAALGLPDEHTAFDVELTMYVNSVLSRLTQLGVGPKEGFQITGKTETWDEFLGANQLLINNARSYMVVRVKLMFDPPEVGFVLTAMKEQIEKDEVLLNYVVDDAIPVKEETSVEPYPYFG